MAKRSRRPVTPRPAPQTPPPAPDADATTTPDSLASTASPSTTPSPPSAPSTSTARPTTTRKRSTNRPRRTVAAEPTFFEKYRTWIIGGVAVIGLLIVGYFLFLSPKGPTGGVASGPKYVCDSLLTPQPNGTIPPVEPTLPPTPTPTASPTPTATPTATATAIASGSPSASGSPAATSSPTPSPTASPSPTPTPTASPSPTPTPEPTAPLGQSTSILGRDHVLNAGQTIEYGFCPPTSGSHYNVAGFGPIRSAVYPNTAEQPPGGWVHNLEHGWVVQLYSCKNGCPTDEEMAQMQQWFDNAPAVDPAQGCSKEVLVARFDSMDTNFATLAWGRALLTDEFDLDMSTEFAQQWMDHGTEPEPGIC